FNTFINHYSTRNFNNGEYPSYEDKGKNRVAWMTWRNRESVNTFPDITKSFNLAYTAYYKPATGLILLREYILEPEIIDQVIIGYIHRSEEHTSELQSRENLVCRLLLEKKNKKTRTTTSKTE